MDVTVAPTHQHTHTLSLSLLFNGTFAVHVLHFKPCSNILMLCLLHSNPKVHAGGRLIRVSPKEPLEAQAQRTRSETEGELKGSGVQQLLQLSPATKATRVTGQVKVAPPPQHMNKSREGLVASSTKGLASKRFEKGRSAAGWSKSH